MEGKITLSMGEKFIKMCGDMGMFSPSKLVRSRTLDLKCKKNYSFYVGKVHLIGLVKLGRKEEFKVYFS
jgi:hypothetical protein